MVVQEKIKKIHVDLESMKSDLAEMKSDLAEIKSLLLSSPQRMGDYRENANSSGSLEEMVIPGQNILNQVNALSFSQVQNSMQSPFDMQTMAISRESVFTSVIRTSAQTHHQAQGGIGINDTLSRTLPTNLPSYHTNYVGNGPNLYHQIRSGMAEYSSQTPIYQHPTLSQNLGPRGIHSGDIPFQTNQYPGIHTVGNHYSPICTSAIRTDSDLSYRSMTGGVLVGNVVFVEPPVSQAVQSRTHAENVGPQVNGDFCPALAKSVKTMNKTEKEYGFGEKGKPVAGEEGAIPPDDTLLVNLELVSEKTATEMEDEDPVCEEDPEEVMQGNEYTNANQTNTSSNGLDGEKAEKKESVNSQTDSGYSSLMISRLKQEDMAAMAQSTWGADKRLDVYIHNYLWKRDRQKTAKAFHAGGNVPSNHVAIDDPRGFPFEWWSVLWDIFIARKNNNVSGSLKQKVMVSHGTISPVSFNGEMKDTPQVKQNGKQNRNCWHCNEVWTSGHNQSCQVRNVLNTLLMQSEEMTVEVEEEDNPGVPAGFVTTTRSLDDAEKKGSSEQLMQIPAYAVHDLGGMVTSAVKVSRDGKPVIALVERWSTNSFMDYNYTVKNGFTLSSMPCRKVQDAGGGELTSEARVENLAYEIQNTALVTSFRLLKLGNYNIILGADWIYEFSPIELDLKEKLLTINKEGQKVQFCDFSQPNINFMLKAEQSQNLAHKSVNGLLIQVNPIEHDQKDVGKQLSQVIENKLREYADVFAEYSRKFILIFCDDIFVYGKGWSEQLNHLRIALQTLREIRLAAKILNDFQAEANLKDEFRVEAGNIKCKGRIYVGKRSNLISVLLDSSHNSGLGGHSDMRSSYHTALKTTPFQALYGYHPFQLAELTIPCSVSEEAKVAIKEKEKMLRRLKKNPNQVQSRMKRFANRRRTERSFTVGIHLVFLFCQLKKHASSRAVPLPGLALVDSEVLYVAPSRF